MRALAVPFGKRTETSLLTGPPDAATVKRYYKISADFWNALKANFNEMNLACRSKPDQEIAGKYRTADGGHFLFRPFCLIAFAKAVRVLHDRGMSIRHAVKVLAKAEMHLAKNPWQHVVWNPSKNVMVNKNEPLVRNLLLHEAGQALAPADFNLEKQYLTSVGEAQTNYKL